MAKKSSNKKSKSKSTIKAAKALHGSDTTPAQKISQTMKEFSKPKDGSVFGGRLTWRALRLFLYFALILDLVAYFITSFVFEKCYGIMCWIN